jgi:hypothetical protein
MVLLSSIDGALNLCGSSGHKGTPMLAGVRNHRLMLAARCTRAAIREAAHAHEAKLRKNGVLMGAAGIPVQVRNPNAAQLETTNGPFMTSSLPLARFAIIEAANLAEAVDIVSRTVPRRRQYRQQGSATDFRPFVDLGPVGFQVVINGADHLRCDAARATA